MPDLLLKILVIAPQLLIAVILHEIAHGYMAYKLGDPTAKNLGRLTLNPIKHIDPVMTLLIPGMLIAAGSPVVFGGAKPVPVNWYNFKDPLKGAAIVAIAGPLTNIFLAAFWIGVRALIHLIPESDSLVMILIESSVVYGIIVNVVLAVFNLFPLPPLDGGRIAVALLPRSLAVQYAKLEKFGLMILFALLYAGIPQRVIGPVLGFVMKTLGIDIK